MTSDDESPSVILAGKSYPVPPLAFREVSKIVPIVGTVFSKEGMSEASLEALAKVVFYGIKRGAPDLTLDALLDMPVTIEEMSAAALVICAQAGLKKKDASAGEAKGAMKPPISKN